LADPGLVERCRSTQPAWSVGSLAAAALPELLAAVDLPGWRDGIVSLRHRLGGVLAAHGLHARPSDANWVLVDAPGLRDALAPHGIVVRDCASFGLAGVARIAVPDEDGIERLDRALSAAGDRRTTERHVVSAERTA
jgi:histidinol-phosphate/aromatic aminotransferase/cobyric acid decarboxylase-like protein